VAPPANRSQPKVALFGKRLGLPGRGSIAWYAGVGAITALEIIEWPVALVLATSHALATHARDPAARELGQGTEPAA